MLQNNPFIRFIFLLFFIEVVIHFPTAAMASQHEPPLKLSEPIETIIADLERNVPAYLREQNIPGVALALIRNRKIVWTQGFGVANTLTRRPITPETVFEVASNSKVVTAYIALRLVDQGRLSLDEPLNSYLAEPWLPPSAYRDRITLRQVLSHSSGLGHNTTSRQNRFAPGRGYSYSAIGYQYLQAVIEQITGHSLEQVARDLVFNPLGMASSSFVSPKILRPRTANGHLHAILPVILFAISYVVCLFIIGLIGMVIVKFRTGQWRPAQRIMPGIFSATFLFSLMPFFILFGMSGLMEFAWLIALGGGILTVIFVFFFFIGRVVCNRILDQHPELQKIVLIVWSILILIGLAGWTHSMKNVPVPKWPEVKATAAASMRATVGDLASFLIELSHPRNLSTEIASQLATPQIKLSRNLSWGLGPGIHHSRQGDALW